MRTIVILICTLAITTTATAGPLGIFGCKKRCTRPAAKAKAAPTQKVAKPKAKPTQKGRKGVLRRLFGRTR